jgi:hypothetical protein
VLCPSCTILWRDGALQRNGGKAAQHVA